MNAWSNLPNAQHIDHVLAHLKANHRRWAVAWDTSDFASTACRSEAYRAAWVSVVETEWAPAGPAAWAAFKDALKVMGRSGTSLSMRVAAVTAAGGVVAALIAWDRAGSYLSLTPDQIKTLAYLGDRTAVLMLPAVMALKSSTLKLQEKQNALQ